MSSDKQSPENNNDFLLENLFNVKGKVAVISGGGSGIGLMQTQALAVNGAKCYIIGRTMEKLQTVADIYGKNIAGQIIPLQGDVTKKDDIKRIYEEIASKEKCVCILINNAGIASNTVTTEASSADEMKKNCFEDDNNSFEDWVNCYQTNVPQCYFMTMCFLPLLEASTKHQHGWTGTVINTCSISGIVKVAQHHFAYNASKAAVIHLTKMLSCEIADKNNLKVRINSIAPGVYPSEMTANDSLGNQKSELPKEDFEEKVPARRPGNDRDMGNATLFAATNQYLQGQIITVDGGYVIRAGSA